MYLTFKKVCKDNQDIWSNMPVFVNTFDRFEKFISEIITQQEIQKGKTTGITQNKQKEEKEMIQATVEIASATKRLEELFKEKDILLKNQLDMLMVNYKTENSEFYNIYRSARIIVDIGKRRSEEESEIRD